MKVTVHLVSDSTGETIQAVAKSSLAQFKILEPLVYHHFLIRTENKLNHALDCISENPGLVFSTLVHPSQAIMLEEKCKELKIPYMAVLDDPVKKISEYTGITDVNWGSEQGIVGIQHSIITPEYEKRMEAIQFAIAQDDGQNIEAIFYSEILILGVSRTGKTPLSIYLANKGYKTSNVPLVPGCEINGRLVKFLVKSNKRNPLTVGLTISPEILVEIRKNRLKHLSHSFDSEDNPYTNFDIVKSEIIEFRKFFAAYNVPTLLVDRTSIEELATKVIDLLES